MNSEHELKHCSLGPSRVEINSLIYTSVDLKEKRHHRIIEKELIIIITHSC